MLLSELMRIKAEGDYDAIKALVVSTASISTPNSATRWCSAIQTRRTHLLVRHNSDHGQVRLRRKRGSCHATYPRDFVKQQLGYAAMYGLQ